MVKYTHFKSAASEHIMADIISSDGQMVSHPVATSSQALRNVFIMDRYILWQTSTQLVVNSMAYFYQSPLGFAYTNKFVTGTSSPLIHTGVDTWNLVDVWYTQANTGNIGITMKKADGQFFVATMVDGNLNGNLFTTDDADAILYCSHAQLCFDIVNAKLYVTRSFDNSPLGATLPSPLNSLDLWPINYNYAGAPSGVFVGTMITEYKIRSDSATYDSTVYFLDSDSAFLRMKRYSYTSQMRVFKNTQVSDYLEYDGIQMRYFFTTATDSAVQSAPQNTINEIILIQNDASDITPFIVLNGIQQFSFSRNYLFMMADNLMIIVKKPKNSGDYVSYYNLQADSFLIDTKLILNSGLTTWIDALDTDIYIVTIQCKCIIRGLGYMECFENSVCVFIAANVFGQCEGAPSSAPN